MFFLFLRFVVLFVWLVVYFFLGWLLACCVCGCAFALFDHVFSGGQRTRLLSPSRGHAQGPRLESERRRDKGTLKGGHSLILTSRLPGL